MQAYIADFDMISDSNYNGKWMQNYAELRTELNKKNEYPINISICNGFITVLTSRERVYNIPCSDDQEKPKVEKMDFEGTPQKIQTTDDSGYVLTTDNRVYVWGDNKNG